MESATQRSLLHAGLHIGYMDYHATGKGVRCCASACWQRIGCRAALRKSSQRTFIHSSTRL